MWFLMNNLRDSILVFLCDMALKIYADVNSSTEVKRCVNAQASPEGHKQCPLL